MSVILVLLGYAGLVGMAAPRALALARWPRRAPRLAIALWQALSVSFLITAVLIGLAVAMPVGASPDGLPGFLRACAAALHGQFGTVSGAALAAIGIGLAIVVIIRSGWYLVREVGSARRERAMHAQAVELVGRPAPQLGAYLIDHPAAGVYCLPGRARRIVVTTGALEALSRGELAAVLAHERAHLSGRHHLVLAAAQALARAFPRIPVFTRARAELAVLVEMRADDAAGAGHGRRVVAGALCAVASAAAAPRAALAAGGTAALARVQRLIDPGTPLTWPARLAGAVAVAGSPLLPIAAAFLPVLLAVQVVCCPALG